MFFLEVLCIVCVSQGEKLRSISIPNEGICELYNVKYMDEKVHSSTQTDDREEGIALVMFVYLFYQLGFPLLYQKIEVSLEVSLLFITY